MQKGSKPKTHFIHQLVAHEWVINPDGKECVDHIDGSRVNNHHENLGWASHSENSRNMKNTSTVRVFTKEYPGIGKQINGELKSTSLVGF